MGLFDGADQLGGSMFNIGDPNSMMLLGALQGLGATGAASRMPITPAAVWGGLGGGLLAGQKAASDQMMQQQQISSEAAKNALLMDQITKQAAALGQPVPTMKDIRTGRWQGFDWNNIFGQSGGGLFSPAQQAQPTLPQPTGAGGLGPLGNAGLTAPYNAPPPGVGGKVSDIANKVAAISQSKGFDPQFGIEHLGGESDLNPNAVGPALTDSGKPQERPKGIAQLTSDQMHGGDPMNVDQSLAVYGDIMSKLLAKTNGDYVKAAQLYGSIPKDLSTMNRGEQRIYMAAAAANERVKSGQTPPFQLAQNAPGGAAGTGGGVPQPAQQQMPQPGQPSPPISGLMTPQQALIYQARLQALGGKPSEVSQAWLDASFTPPGPLQDLLIASAQNKAGVKPFLGGEKPGAPLLKAEPGGAGYTVAMPQGYPQAVNTLTRAGPAGMAPQTIVNQDTGVPYEAPRGQVFAPGNPPVPVGLSPEQKAARERQGQNVAEWGPLQTPAPPGTPPMAVPPAGLPPPVSAPVAPPPAAPIATPPPLPARPPLEAGMLPGAGGATLTPTLPPAQPVTPVPAPPAAPATPLTGGQPPTPTGPPPTPLVATPPPTGPVAPPRVVPPGAENTNSPVPLTYAQSNQTARLYSPIVDPVSESVLPPLSRQVLPKSYGALKDMQPDWNKKVAGWTADAKMASQAEQRLWVISDAMHKFESGTWAEEKAGVAAAFKAVGLNKNINELLGTDPAAVQTAIHENLLEAFAAVKAAIQSGRVTQAEIFGLAKVSTAPNVQPEANQQMLADGLTLLQRAQKLPQAWGTATNIGPPGENWINPDSFEAEWIQRNPLQPQVEEMKKYIGPLKGMRPTAGATPGVPQEGMVVRNNQTGHQLQVRDGQWIDLTTGKPFVAPPVAPPIAR